MGIIERIIHALTRPKREPKPWRASERFSTYRPFVVCNYCLNRDDKKPHPSCRACGMA